MDFVDATLLRLADPAQRAGLFDQPALAQLARVTGGRIGADAEGPYSATFDEVRLMFDDDATTNATGAWTLETSGARTLLDVRMSGLPTIYPRIDAVWKGSIAATVRIGGDRIDRLEVAWPDVAGVDAEIQPLPTDPAARESARRTRFIMRVRAHLANPAAFDDAALDRFLARLHVSTISALIDTPSRNDRAATLQIKFEPPTAVVSTRRPFAFAAAALIRTVPVSLAGLLADSRRARTALDRLGIAVGGDQAQRATPIVVWFLPATLFDEQEWPGGGSTGTPAEKRERRRAWANDWLAREGVGLVVPSA